MLRLDEAEFTAFLQAGLLPSLCALQAASVLAQAAAQFCLQPPCWELSESATHAQLISTCTAQEADAMLHFLATGAGGDELEVRALSVVLSLLFLRLG